MPILKAPKDVTSFSVGGITHVVEDGLVTVEGKDHAADLVEAHGFTVATLEDLEVVETRRAKRGSGKTKAADKSADKVAETAAKQE